MHGDTKPSLAIYEDHAYCFGCGFIFYPTDKKPPISRLNAEIALYLQELLKSAGADEARAWLSELTGLDQNWLNQGFAAVAESKVVLPLGFCPDPADLAGFITAKAKELGLSDKEAKRIASDITNPIAKGTDWVAFFYETSPGKVTSFKFRPVGAPSRESRAQRGNFTGVFGLGMLEPSLFDHQPVVVVEGDTDVLAIQAAAIRAGQLRPIIASGGASRFEHAARILERLTPKGKRLLWPDLESGAMLNARRVVRHFEGVILPEAVDGKIDPRDFALGKSIEEIDALVRSSLLAPEDFIEKQLIERAQEPPYFTWASLPEAAPIDIVVDRILGRRLITLLAARPGAFKTWTACHIALCVIQGKPVFRNFPARSGHVLYVTSDSPAEMLATYLRAVAKATEEPTEPESIAVVENVNLSSHQDLLGFRKLIARLRPDLIIFDTIAKCAAIDENDNAAVNQLFASTLQPIAREQNCALLLIRHVRKSQGRQKDEPQDAVLGAVARVGLPDIVLLLTRHGTAWSFNVKFIKSRLGEPDDFKVTVEIHQDEQGRAEKAELIYAGTIVESQLEVEECSGAILTWLAEKAEGHAATTREIKEAMSAQKFSARTVDRALKVLKEAGDLFQPKRGLWRFRQDLLGESGEREGGETENADAV